MRALPGAGRGRGMDARRPGGNDGTCDRVAATARPEAARAGQGRGRAGAPPERPAPPHGHEPEPEPAPVYEHAEEPLADVEPSPPELVGEAEPDLEPEPVPPEPEPAPELAETPAPEPDSPERRIRHAIGAFNDSDQPRVVAGLMRSLGEPNAAIAETGGEPATALVTIAWELSWYRWEVAADGTADVREVAKGGEVSEIDGGEPDWNAAVNEEGKLRWRESS